MRRRHGLDAVTFDKFVDACNAFFCRTSTDKDKQDVENEIANGIVGESIIECCPVDHENQSTRSLFEMKIGTNRALGAPFLQEGAKIIEELGAALFLKGYDRGEKTKFARVIGMEIVKFFEFIFGIAEEDFKCVVGLRLYFGTRGTVGEHICLDAGQDEPFFAFEELIERSFRDVQGARNVVHRHIANTLGFEKLIRIADHFVADAFVAFCEKFGIHYGVSEGAKWE